MDPAVGRCAMTMKNVKKLKINYFLLSMLIFGSGLRTYHDHYYFQASCQKRSS